MQALAVRVYNQVLSPFVLPRLRLWALLLVGAFVLVAARYFRPVGDGGSKGASLAIALVDDDLVDVRHASWVGEPTGLLGSQRVFFVARTSGELSDLYSAEVSLASGDRITDVRWLTNVSRTSGAEEQSLLAVGSYVAYLSRVGERLDAIEIIDTRGESESVTAGWSLRERLQNRVTNLQTSGTSDGLGRTRFALNVPAQNAVLARDGDRIVLNLPEGKTWVFDTATAKVTMGMAFATGRMLDKGRPSFIGWAVDTVRKVTGPGPIEWLEHRVYGAKDAVLRAFYGTFGNGTGDNDAAAADLGVTDVPVDSAQARERERLTVPDAELGWPPHALTPVLPEPTKGEGEWIPVVDDPFVKSNENAPPAFYQTYLHTDPERTFTRIYITIWDPRQVQLNMMPGTREPESATGETGEGRVPTDPDTVSRLVGAFNGGFQALHGEFGMMHNKRVYLPPKPWSATVAVFEDGRVGMGSWPGPPEGATEYVESVATAQIPGDMIAYRQNLTSVVEGGRFNPWERWYWGAAPLNASAQTFIDRTGMCVTAEGFMAHFWGQSMGPEAMGAAMNAARCTRGMHLDMNSRHAGFVFFNTGARTLSPLERALVDDYEFEGDYPGVSGVRYRARLGVRTMSLAPFPRWVEPDPRDFFYLTLKSVLPGGALSIDGKSLAFESKGLPHDGWPPAFARASVGAESSRVWLVRIDPARAEAAPLREASKVEGGKILGWYSGAGGQGELALSATRALPGWRYEVGRASDTSTAILRGEALATSPNAKSGVCVDSSGFLLYAEREGASSASLARVLGGNVCRSPVLALPDGAALALNVDGIAITANGKQQLDVRDAVALVSDGRPRAAPMFEDVQPLPYRSWSRLQDARVRYRPQSTPRFIRPAM